MSVTACDNSHGIQESRWPNDNAHFKPCDWADQALQDRAGSLYAEVDRVLNRLLCEDLSVDEREKVYRYLDDLHQAWAQLNGDGHSFRQIREEYGGQWISPSGHPEYILDYCNDHYDDFIHLAETTLGIARGLSPQQDGPGVGHIEDWSSGSLASDLATNVPGEYSHIQGITGDSATGAAEEEGSSWITDPNEVLRRYEQDPEGFYQAMKEMTDEDRMLAMFSLQRAAEINSQIMQTVSNLLQGYHEATMAVVRNLRA